MGGLGGTRRAHTVINLGVSARAFRIYTAIKRIAKKQDRSIASMARVLLVQAIDAMGEWE
ncbi:MAG: hypothetical protein ACYSWU_18240 [Planctomycetota bacterium]|jgi:hypothetical protein